MSIAVISLAAARTTLHYGRVENNNLALFINQNFNPESNTYNNLWHLQGTVITEPVIKHPQPYDYARFDYIGPRTYFQMKVNAAIGNNKTVPLTGKILIRIETPDERFQIGDIVKVRGSLIKFPPPANPGEYNRNQLAKIQGLAGVLVAKTRENVSLIGQSSSIRDKFLRWRAKVRRKASSWILDDIQKTETQHRESLLAALILGNREQELEEITVMFRRTGLAHLLAISGLHLAILAWTILLVVKLPNPPPQLERITIILFIIVYLFIVPARVPVWRAGIMILALTIAAMTGRKLSPLSFISFAAAILLIWNPSDLFQPGFQLSFGIVTGLILFTDPVYKRFFGSATIDPDLRTKTQIAKDYMKTTFAATFVAWLTSFPLVAYHFGYVCPLAIPATLLAMPMVTTILAIGFFKGLTAVLLPFLTHILSPILSTASDYLIIWVRWVDQIPFSSIVVGYPGKTWAIITALLCLWWLTTNLHNKTKLLYIRRILFVLIICWLAAARLGLNLNYPNQAGRLIMPAVGNGSCIIIDTGKHNQAIMYDCGSSSFPQLGSNLIVPTLRRLGIFKIPTIILSHNDLDHYSGTLDVIKEMQTQNLYVTQQMINAAKQNPASPIAKLFDQAHKLNVNIQIKSAGDTLTYNNNNNKNKNKTTITWLHPHLNDNYEKDNDNSAVIKLTIANRNILLTGDIQSESIKHLLTKHTTPPTTTPTTLTPTAATTNPPAPPSDSLLLTNPDIMDLPHHGGSWSKEAEELINTVNPDIILQSTAPKRLLTDKWNINIAKNNYDNDINNSNNKPIRYTTATHGCIIISIKENGNIVVQTQLKP